MNGNTRNTLQIDYSDIATLLQCPLTKEDLHYTSESFQIETFLDVFEANEAFQFDHGYFNDSKTAFYPIVDDIIVLLPEESFNTLNEIHTNVKSLAVKKFYEEFGWNKSENEEYNDEAMYVDSRAISQDYHSRTTARTKKYLTTKGKYLLDVASGPIYQPDYQSLSDNFEKRICIDISKAALTLAKKHIGLDRGIFIMGDITNLPLRDELCDNVVSFHTIYHVPKENQEKAITELIRVCSRNSNVVIAYNWAWHSWLMNLILLPKKIYNGLKRFYTMYLKSKKSETDLYFYAYPPSWFDRKFGKNPKLDLSYYCLQSLHVDFLRFYIHESFFGEKVLNRILKIEEKYSKFLGRNGAYPFIVISKK